MAAGGSFIVGSIVAKLVLDKSGWNQSVSGVMSDAKKMTGMSASTSRAFTQVGSTLAVMGGAILGFFGAMVAASSRSQASIRQLDAVLKSTGGAAGVTREQAIGLSEEMQKLTTFSHETVLEAENLLLTFTNIGKDIFPEATKVVLDMSTALGQDLKASSIQVGKALQDPILGMTALRRVGVNFTKEQSEMVKVLVKTGHSLDAQKFILRELGTEFGGSSLAAAQGFGGQMKQLKNELDDVKEEIGVAVVPIFKQLVAQIKPIVIGIKDWIAAHPALVGQIGMLLIKIGGIMLVLGPIMIAIPRLVQLFGLLKLAVAALTGPFGIALAGLAAISVAINKFINDHKKALDAEIAKETEYGNKLGELSRLRSSAIEKGIIKQSDWQTLVNRFGRDYMKVYQAIATMPEYAKLKAVMDENIAKQGEMGQAIKAVGASAGGAKDPIFDLAESISAAQKAEKEWTEYLKSAGILTIKEKSDKIAELLGYEDRLAQMLIDGKIDVLEYGKAVAGINEELEKFGGTLITNTLPPAEDLSDVLKRAVPEMHDVAYATADFEDQLKAAGDTMSVSAATVLRELYNIRRGFLLTMGIMIPEWKDFEVAGKEAATETGGAFDGLYNDVARGFGDMIQSVLSGSVSLKDGLKRLWDEIKGAFFTMVGEMASRWLLSMMKDIVGGATSAAAGAGTAFSGLAATVGSIAATIGTVITTLAAAIGTAIGAIAAGIATAIVAVATAIATAATILAAAIVPLLTVGAMALALYVAFMLAKGILDKLFGGGGGDKSTQMAQDSRNFLAEIRNWLFSAGSGFGGASYSFITAHIGDWLGWVNSAVNDRGIAIKSAVDLARTEICKRIDATNKMLWKLGGAAAGAIVEQPALMSVAEREPEAIIPLSKFPMLARAGGGGTVNITLRLEGQIITDRDYVRRRILPELIEALDSSVHKVRFQQRLGVAS
jgi:hypothetical protein